MNPYDALLYFSMFLIIGVLVFEFIKLIREDPDYWLIARDNQAFMKIWNFLEKAEPEKNKSLLERESES